MYRLMCRRRLVHRWTAPSWCSTGKISWRRSALIITSTGNSCMNVPAACMPHVEDLSASDTAHAKVSGQSVGKRCRRNSNLETNEVTSGKIHRSRNRLLVCRKGWLCLSLARPKHVSLFHMATRRREHELGDLRHHLVARSMRRICPDGGGTVGPVSAYG